MAWSLLDFVIAGGLFSLVGLAFVILLKPGLNIWYRIGLGISLLGSILLILANGAVGLIGSEENPANLFFFLLPLIGFGLALTGRFQPAIMRNVLAIMAVTQIGIGTTAMTLGWGSGANAWPFDIMGATGIFTIIWIISAFCFHLAARDILTKSD